MIWTHSPSRPMRSRPHALAVVFLLMTGTIVASPIVELASTASPVSAATRTRAGDRIAIGWDHACAVTPEGTVVCWGDNTNGELGVASPTRSATPVTVSWNPAWRGVAVAVGEHHSCALLADGEIACWGSDIAGALGAGSGTEGPAPVLVDLPADRTATQIEAGPIGTCAILDHGGVVCWGFQINGELGQSANGTVHTPQSVFMPAGETAVDLSVGHTHGCAVLDTGGITCWGLNTHGQFGNATTAPSATTGSASTPILLDGGHHAVAVTVGWNFTCAVTETGRVNCWGLNTFGQLGTGDTINRTSPTPISPVPNTRAVDVTASEVNACARLDTGAVACWGGNTSGQLGDGFGMDQSSPVDVALTPGDTVRELAGGDWSSCAVFTTGDVTCWGRNQAGQLGDGTTTTSFTPVTPWPLTAGTRIRQVETGGNHTCLLNTAGDVWCWGQNSTGQTGRGTFTLRELDPAEPLDFPGDRPVVALAAGINHTCALLDTGEVSCWGSNNTGQLGIGVPGDLATPSSPITLPGSQRARALSAGGTHTCALLTDGSITCWGFNQYGQLGNGDNIDQFTPAGVVSLPGGVPAVSITTGLQHTCAVQANGAMTCWGRNEDGQVGDATHVDRNVPVVVDVPPGTRARSIDAGRFHTCALLVAATVSCWGDNRWGSLGNGLSGTSQSAMAGTVNLPGGPPTQAVELSLGDAHSCALLDDGTASCWGYNGQGGLGDGTLNNSTIPIAVSPPAGTRFVALSAGFNHTCALFDRGEFGCWGDNWNGQLGTGDRTDLTSPSVIALDPTPSDLTGSPGDTQVVLTWADPTSPFQPQTWTVEASTDGITWWSATTSAIGPNATTVSGLTNSVAYRFRVTTATPLATASAQTLTSVTPLAAASSPAAIPPPPPEATGDEAVYETISGTDPADLAVRASRRLYPRGSAPVVHVALATRWVDAVIAGAAARSARGPLLLVDAESLPRVTAGEIARLASQQVIVVGGPEAVSDAVVQAIEDLGNVTVTRIWGPDRATTAGRVSQDVYDPGVDTVYLVSQSSPIDGLGVAAFGGPVLLSGRDVIPEATWEELRRLDPDTIVVVGGTRSISSTVTERLEALTTAEVIRWAGEDRHATAAIVAGSHPGPVATVVMAAGDDLGALGALTALAEPSSVLLLTGSRCRMPATDEALASLRPRRVVVLGDEASSDHRC